MGSTTSRLGSSPPRTRVSRTRRALSCLVCGASSSSSRAPLVMEDFPAALHVNSAENCGALVDEVQARPKESYLTSGTETTFTSPRTETGSSSDSSISASEDTSVEDSSRNVETSNCKNSSSECKELVPSHPVSNDYSHDESNRERNSATASTLAKEEQSSDSVSVNLSANLDAVNFMDDSVNRGVAQNCPEVTHPTNSSSQELGDSLLDGVSVENHVHSSDSGSVPTIPDSPISFHSLRDESLQEVLPSGLGFLVSNRERGRGDGSVLHVDVVSISSNIFSSSNADISNREARRNNRRMFWDAFTRRSSRRHSDSPTIIFSTDDTDDLGSHDRWLLDFGGDFFSDEVGGDFGYLGSRLRRMNERRRHSRSEFWERLRSGIDDNGRRSTFCPSGLHPDGTCSCESFLMTEESSTRASISRIVMLAEALFEVLDEIHRHPASLSLSMVSVPAPESLVDSFPLKNHKKSETAEGGDDVKQCYICLAEYEEGDKIRVLPCHHEYHMLCVDKWLKEIHGVCPLCRGDVRGGITEASVSNSEVPSL